MCEFRSIDPCIKNYLFGLYPKRKSTREKKLLNSCREHNFQSNFSDTTYKNKCMLKTFLLITFQSRFTPQSKCLRAMKNISLKIINGTC